MAEIAASITARLRNVLLSSISVALCLAVLAAGAVASQERVQQAPTTAIDGCDTAGHRAFDFLLGSWSVRSVDGRDAGFVQVTQELGGCAIREEWSSPSGRRGVSLNTYSPATGSWHQTYVDTRGAVLFLHGGPVEGGVVLYDDSGVAAGSTDRFSWFTRPDGSIRQIWERSTGDSSWSPVFEAAWLPIIDQPDGGVDLSEAMRALDGLVGTWDMTPIQRDERGEWKEWPTTVAEVEPVLEGTFLRESAELDISAGRLQYLMLVGFDPFQQVYRISWNDSLVGLADIYEGAVEDGVLVVDNLRSETFWKTRDSDQEFAFRLELDLSPVAGERRMEVYASEDRGASWDLYQTTVYRRRAR